MCAPNFNRKGKKFIMAYENFKPLIWSNQIQHDLAKHAVLQEDCSTLFQGEIGLGKTVKIIGVGRPTVGDYVPGTDIAAAETPNDNAMKSNDWRLIVKSDVCG